MSDSGKGRKPLTLRQWQSILLMLAGEMKVSKERIEGICAAVAMVLVTASERKTGRLFASAPGASMT